MYKLYFMLSVDRRDAHPLSPLSPHPTFRPRPTVPSLTLPNPDRRNPLALSSSSTPSSSPASPWTTRTTLHEDVRFRPMIVSGAPPTLAHITEHHRHRERKQIALRVSISEGKDQASSIFPVYVRVKSMIHSQVSKSNKHSVPLDLWAI
jgi:hypothetical protein